MELRKIHDWASRGMAARRGAALASLALVAALGCGPSPDNFPDEHVDIAIASDESGGGSLAADYDFDEPIEVFESAMIGGFTLWSGADPGFEMLESDEPDEGFYALEDGVTVSLEIVALDPAAQFKFGEVTLDEPGDSVVLGTTPELHGHGEWQLVLPEGVDTGSYELSFRFTTTSAQYSASPSATVTITPTEGEDHDHDEE